MLKAFYSRANKNKLAADAIAELAIDNHEILHLHPKNSKPLNPDFHCFQYEDIGKTKIWLAINNLIEERKIKALILENPTRYAKVTSNKVVRLQKLSTQIDNILLFDIVPFTLDIKYIYTPYSYLDRSILGYPHYYAFRENYGEEDSNGRLRYAHDYDLIVEKIANYCYLDYDYFFARDRHKICYRVTPKESLKYSKSRDSLFKEDLKGNVIATKLADLVHAFKSRAEIVFDLLSRLSGKTRIIFNLASYAKKMQEKCNKLNFDTEIECISYTLASGLEYDDVDNLIYMEYPIVKSYFLLDIEAKLTPDCKVYHIRSDMKVDIYLENKFEREFKQISGFIKELSIQKHSTKFI